LKSPTTPSSQVELEMTFVDISREENRTRHALDILTFISL